MQYHSGELTGSLCKPLCDSKEIKYKKCFPGGNDKVMVIHASWGQREMVLKATKLSFAVNNTLGNYLSLHVNEFKQKVCENIMYTIYIVPGSLIII